MDRSIYSRLKKLFSTNSIVRNVGGTKLKIADVNNIQSHMTNAMRDRYSRIHVGSGYGHMGGNPYGSNMAYQTQRLQLFREYDLADMDPIVSSALDLLADESTTKNEFGEILSIYSDNEQVQEILHNLFYDILNVEFNLWPWVRNLLKYGDFFLFLEISPEYGIHNVFPLSVYDTIRIEGEKPDNPYYVKFKTLGGNGMSGEFDNFEVAHFRLLSDSNFLPYGKSYLENARKILRQLFLMEDALLIHRIMRAPEKRIFKIDVGNIPPNEVDAYVQRIMDRSKKVPFIDPSTGDYNLRYNMQNILEDFYLPVRGNDSGTHIENLQGLENNSIEDIEYLRAKLMAALKIPKAYLGYEEDTNGKSTIAGLDIRFARTIERIQRIIVSELTKIGIIHLYAQGFTDSELVNFELSLTNPSTIYEQEKINLWTQKVGLVAQLQGIKMISTDWMYDNVFSISKEEADRERDKVVEDTKRMFRINQIEQGQPDPAKFGYPQDEEAPTEDFNGDGVGDATAGGPDMGGGDGVDMDGINSVDDLPTAEELGLEEDGDPDGRGRPKKGPVYGQDSHVRGRDPLGFKERYKALQFSPQRAPSKKSPLSLESKYNLSGMSKLTQKSIAMLAEDIQEFTIKEDEGTYLDESKLLIDFDNNE